MKREVEFFEKISLFYLPVWQDHKKRLNFGKLINIFSLNKKANK